MPKKPHKNPGQLPPAKASSTSGESGLRGAAVHAHALPPQVDPANENARPSMQQLRRAPRVEMKIEIGIDDHTNFYVGFSENISAGGLFISTYRLLPVGTPIALTFVLPIGAPVFVHGLVRWVRDPHDPAASEIPPGVGVQFVDLGSAERDRIQAYIEGRAPLFYPE